MDILDSDLISFWRLLKENDVAYIMIGGFAVNLHGFNRTTGDVDIWIEDTKQNRIKLGKTLEVYGYTNTDWEQFTFVPGWTNFTIGNGMTVNILTKMVGLENLEFTKCLQLASIATLEDLQIPFLHINQLIANKKATNRPKDQIDIIELEKIIQIRNNNKQ